MVGSGDETRASVRRGIAEPGLSNYHTSNYHSNTYRSPKIIIVTLQLTRQLPSLSQFLQVHTCPYNNHVMYVETRYPFVYYSKQNHDGTTLNILWTGKFSINSTQEALPQWCEIEHSGSLSREYYCTTQEQCNIRSTPQSGGVKQTIT